MPEIGRGFGPVVQVAYLVPDIDAVQIELPDSQGQVQFVDIRFGNVRGTDGTPQEARKAELSAWMRSVFPQPMAGSRSSAR